MPYTILSVVDDAAVCRVRNEVLREAGFEVIEAVAASDALELASERQPALVVLAVELPGMDGFAVCRRLKADPRTSSIPVLHLSGPGESHRACADSLESGADAWLPEPVEPPVLIAVATALIRAYSGGNMAPKADHQATGAQRQRAGQALRTSEERLRLALDATGAGAFEYRPATGECFWDAGAKAMWGLPPDAEVSYPQVLERIHPEDRTRIRESAETAVTTESPELAEAEYRVIWPDGSVHWISGTSRTFFEGEGLERHAARMMGVHRDITERKRAEEALRDGEKRYRTLFETMTEGFALCEIICDEAGKPCDFRYLAVNPAFQRQTGLKAEDILGRTVLELFPQAESMWIERYGKVALTGEPARFEAWFGPLGRWFEVFVFQTEPGRFGVVFTDITERKRAEEERQRLAAELADRVGELQAILDAAPVAIWIAHDPQCLRITGNAFADQVVTRTERGGNTSRSARPGDAAVVFRAFRRGVEMQPEELPAQAAAATGQQVKQEELDMVFPDGRTVHMLVGAVPLFDAEGRVRGAVTAGADVTRHRRAEEALRESEAVLRSFFDSPGMMRGFVEIIDGAIVHVSCNAAAAEMFGICQESISGKSATDAGASAEVAQSWGSLYEESRRTGKPVSMEYTRRDAAGQVRWMLATASHIGAGPSGHPRFAYTILDLTDRKRAEEALRGSEERFRILADGCPTIIWVTDAEGGLRFVNRTYREFFGVTYEQVEGGKWQPLVHPDDAPEYIGAAFRAVRERTPFRAQARVRRADGEWRWIASYAEPLLAPSGEFLGLAGISPDITERKQAEDALRNSEKLYRAIGESNDYGVWVCAPDGRNTYASESFLKLVGLTQEQCSSFGWGEVLHPDDAERTLALWKECVGSEGRWDIEHRFRGVDGKWHPILARGVPVRDEQGRITCWAGINLDISALKQTEESLRDSESRERARAAELEALMDAAPAAIFVARDAECRYIEGNRMAYDLLRRPQGSNLSMSAPDAEKPSNLRMMRDGVVIPPQDLPVQRALVTRQPVRNCELELVFEDGSSVSLLGDAVPTMDEDGNSRGAVGVFFDITERKRAERRLREAQKLESLGLLAGGVAHDFNNLLVGVVGNASLAQEMLTPDHPAAELLEGVLRTGEQAAHLTRQMLAYSGKGRFVVEALNLSTVIPDMSGLVRPSISKKIALHLDLEEDLPAIEADRGQIQQVFMNLAINAAEAIGSHDGIISVRTGLQNVDARYLQLHPEAAELRPGDYVFLEVRDTGCGMDDATRSRIFDPFFSTKFTGRGLGLAAVAGIVRGHKGAITVASAPGKGSCFTVLLPAAAVPAAKASAADRNAALRGSGVALIVDDERLVREMAKKALERYGYTVLLADSGPAAMDVLRRHPGEIAVVILDLSMPKMGGEETLPELRKIRPQVKVVISSGYSEAETMALFQGQRVSGFIQKPYTATGLAEKVKAAVG
ncbi:MAG TPA: PAS domain S-box protein [Bryobacteraceae bacterium]|nr:PAS domain S-box protein [Bryobacteraceae bacterium]